MNIYRDIVTERLPLDGTFELTLRCNLSCKMCLFRHADADSPRLMAEEKTAQEWIEMAEQAAEAGTLNLLITGGEPLLREDFCEIWEGISKLGFILTLYTNAVLVSDKIMRVLSKYPPHKIGVTVYGVSAQTYEKVCGSASAFERAWNGIKRLRELPSAFEFRTTVIKDNFSEIDELEKKIQSEFGREFVLTQTRTVMHSVRGACTDVETCRLSPEENIKLFFRREFSKMKELVGSEFDPRKAKFTVEKKDAGTINRQRLTLFYCNAGMRSYTITYNGKLLGCQMMECFYTEPFKEGFKSAWERFPSVVSVPKLPGKCIECTDRDFCSTCFAMRYAETGQLDGIPEYACADAKMLRQYYKEEKGYEEI